MEQKRDENHLLIFMLVVFGLEAIIFSASNFKLDEQYRLEVERDEKIKTILQNTPILAKAVSVYDITQNKKIYGRNDEVALPLASLAKNMTIIVALKGHSMDDVVSISPDAFKQEGDYGFFVNEKFKIKDLAEFTLIDSANDGAYALVENVENFLEKMNEKARKIGMENTLFLNSTGLDLNNVQAGAYASAKDVNLMAFYALLAYPEIFRATALPEINFESESGFVHNLKNTNIIVSKIPNLLFSKTGLTDLAGGNLTIIFKNKNDHSIAITILGSTPNGRFSDMESLVNVMYNF